MKCGTCNETLDCNGNPIADTQAASDCWFAPRPEETIPVHPSNAEDVTGMKAVFFTDTHGDPIDVKVLLNQATTPFPVPAGTALGLSPGTRTLTVDKAAMMFSMAR